MVLMLGILKLFKYNTHVIIKKTGKLAIVIAGHTNLSYITILDNKVSNWYADSTLVLDTPINRLLYA